MSIKIAYFKENKKYTKCQILDKLGIDEKKINKIELELLRKEILKEQNDLYSFEYVGLIIAQEILISVLPKVNINTENIVTTNLILNVLDKYRGSGSIRDEKKDEFLEVDNGHESQFIAVIEYILKDFIEYGLFYSEKVEIVNADGEIDWDYTLDRTLPLKIRDSFKYVETYSRKRKLDDSNFIRKLHMIVLNKCCKYISELRMLEFFSGYPNLDYEVEEDILDEKEFVFFELDKALRNEFNDRNINLLNAIKVFLLKCNHFNSKQDVSFYGVKKFQAVWERVCSELTGNDMKKMDISSKMERFSSPIWTFNLDGTETKISNQYLKPDIVSANKLFLKIYDAKYYPIKLHKGKFDNIPNLEDVMKQFLYGEVLSKYYQNKTILNSFLFPYDNGQKKMLTYVGKINTGIFSERKIRIILVDFKMALEKFLV